ncbi:hypothetical protein BGZ60DRAFT_419435 [Tricladium varicosporioides]|nr:hypothetical protein BGZ60DRAFT_419435 [Hymenoscyphus varicosporioides]
MQVVPESVSCWFWVTMAAVRGLDKYLEEHFLPPGTQNCTLRCLGTGEGASHHSQRKKMSVRPPQKPEWLQPSEHDGSAESRITVRSENAERPPCLHLHTVNTLCSPVINRPKV